MSWLSLSTILKKVREHSLDANQLLTWKKRLKYVSLAVGILFIATHITVRFFLWPQVESHKATFEHLVSQNIGAQLKIEEIKTDWNFLWPSFTIKNIAIYDRLEKKFQASPDHPRTYWQCFLGEYLVFSAALPRS